MKHLLAVLLIGVAFFGLTGVAKALPVDLALSGTATESSTAYTNYGGDSGYASAAIDGNTDGSYYDGSVTHTNNEMAWWKVDLGKLYDINQIVIWNRTDCCSDRLSNFYVSILNNNGTPVWTQNYYTAGGNPNPSLTIDLPAGGIIGETVKIGLNSPNYLSLAEVQVYGANAVPVPPSVLLFAPGLVGLVGIRKRFKTHRL